MLGKDPKRECKLVRSLYKLQKTNTLGAVPCTLALPLNLQQWATSITLVLQNQVCSSRRLSEMLCAPAQSPGRPQLWRWGQGMAMGANGRQWQWCSLAKWAKTWQKDAGGMIIRVVPHQIHINFRVLCIGSRWHLARLHDRMACDRFTLELPAEICRFVSCWFSNAPSDGSDHGNGVSSGVSDIIHVHKLKYSIILCFIHKLTESIWIEILKTPYIIIISRWWFQICFYFHPYLGKIPILTHIFQMAWNRQPDIFWKGLQAKYLVAAPVLWFLAQA